MDLKHGVKVLPCQSSVLCQFELSISQVDNAMEVLLVGKVAPYHGSIVVSDPENREKSRISGFFQKSSRNVPKFGMGWARTFFLGKNLKKGPHFFWRGEDLFFWKKIPKKKVLTFFGGVRTFFIGKNP